MQTGDFQLRDGNGGKSVFGEVRVVVRCVSGCGCSCVEWRMYVWNAENHAYDS